MNRPGLSLAAPDARNGIGELMMRTFNTNEMTQQFDNLFMAPARAYMNLSISDAPG